MPGRPDPLLSFRVTRTDHATVVAATGEIDAHTAERLTRNVESLLSDGDVIRLVVDLAGVTFVDSSGLRAIVDARVRALSRQVPLRIGDMSPQVRRLLEVSGMLELFEEPVDT